MLRKISAGSPFLPGVRTALFCTFVLTLLSGCSGPSGGGGAVVSFPTPTFTGPLSSMTEPVTFDATAATIQSCSPLPCIPATSSTISPRSPLNQITIDPIAGSIDITSGPISLSFDGINYLGGATIRATDTEVESGSVTERLTLLLPGDTASTLDWASYGVWSITTDISPGNQLFDGGALSFGVLTPLNDMPTSGTANYNTGFMDGLYVNAARETFNLTGGAKLTADFKSLKVTGLLDNIQAVRILASPPQPTSFGNIVLDGSISGNNFVGSANSTGIAVPLSGSVQGSFYGPAAQEAGGVFQIKNVGGTEHAVGAFAVRK